jgi:hypothetical protein
MEVDPVMRMAEDGVKLGAHGPRLTRIHAFRKGLPKTENRGCCRLVGKPEATPRFNWLPIHVNWRNITITLIDQAVSQFSVSGIALVTEVARCTRSDANKKPPRHGAARSRDLRQSHPNQKLITAAAYQSQPCRRPSRWPAFPSRRLRRRGGSAFRGAPLA